MQTTAQASVVGARWRSARRSWRTARRRKWPGHAGVRSMTRLCRPRRALVSTPRRAMRGATPRARHSRRHRAWSYPLSACGLAGRDAGGPGAPSGPAARRPASAPACGCRGGWRRSGSGRAGCRARPRRRAASCPACRGRSGSARSLRPPSRPDARAAERRPRPVDGPCGVQAVEEDPVQPRPDPGGVPLAQPAPAGLAGAARFGRDLAPLRTGAQHEEHAREGRAVRRPRPPAARFRPLRGRPRRDRRPEVVGNVERHRPPTPPRRFCP